MAKERNFIKLSLTALLLIVAAVVVISWHSTTKKNIDTVSPTANTSKVVLHSAHYNDVAAWMRKYGTFIKTIQADNNSAHDATTQKDYALLQEACGQERTDVESIQKYPAVPDAQTAKDMQSLLDELDAYTNDCVDGAADAQNGPVNEDVAQVNRSATELDSASSHLNKAIDSIDAFNADLDNVLSSN